MTDNSEESPPVPGIRAGEDRDAKAEAGWPRTTEEEGEASRTGIPEALEDEAPVRQAIDDDTSTAAFEEHPEEDRGRDAPEFREPSGNED